MLPMNSSQAMQTVRKPLGVKGINPSINMVNKPYWGDKVTKVGDAERARA